MFKFILRFFSVVAFIASMYGAFYVIHYIDHNYYEFWVVPTEILTVVALLFVGILLAAANLAWPRKESNNG